MKTDHSPYQILSDGSVQMGQTTFHPWPRFEISGLRVDVPNRIHLLLTSKDPTLAHWRKDIPPETITALEQFDTNLLPDLLTVAQCDPEKFLDWAKFCPALLVLALYSKGLEANVDKERIFRLMHCGWRTVLVERGWIPKRSTLRILQKIKPACLNNLVFGLLRNHLKCPRKLRIIQHLKRIDYSMIDTLHLPPEVLSVNLVELSGNKAKLHYAQSIRHLCEEIMHYRKEMNLLPLWPYKSGQISDETLFHADQRIIMYRSLSGISSRTRFPKPPLSAFRTSKFEAVPISTPRELYAEGICMRNCLPGYAAQIACGTHYAYRVLKPERASLLLTNTGNDWMPSQLKTRANGTPKATTVKMVQAWIGKPFPREEDYDAPF